MKTTPPSQQLDNHFKGRRERPTRHWCRPILSSCSPTHPRLTFYPKENILSNGLFHLWPQTKAQGLRLSPITNTRYLSHTQSAGQLWARGFYSSNQIKCVVVKSVGSATRTHQKNNNFLISEKGAGKEEGTLPLTRGRGSQRAIRFIPKKNCVKEQSRGEKTKVASSGTFTGTFSCALTHFH